jgi:DNA mismatch endonuclease, patch repair protein
MRRQARRDTGVEVRLRRALWTRGLRYRLDRPVVLRRRRHDIVFLGPKVVVDVRGCFWHGCAEHGMLPKANREWWRAKIEANRSRDEDTERRLEEAGWKVVVVWEHDDIDLAADVIDAVVRSRRAA